MATLTIEATEDEIKLIAIAFCLLFCLIFYAVYMCTNEYDEINLKKHGRWHWSQNFDEILVKKHKWFRED